MAKVVIAPLALHDLNTIFDYVSADSEYYAQKIVEKILLRISILETHTHIGKVVREFNNPMIRELIESPYRIIYKIDNENEIAVVHIYHGSRLLKKL